MNTKRFAFVALFIGLFGIACTIVQMETYEGYLSLEWDYTASKWNTLAFFTVISNLAADVWLILLALSVFLKKKSLFDKLTAPEIHGGLTLYMLTVGIIYCGLLFWFIGPYSMTLWWGNVIDMWKHLVMPLFMGAVFIFAPHTKLMHIKTLGYWMIYPAVYFIFSLIRGLITGWYPYPFFKPSWIQFPFGIIMTVCVLVGFAYAIISLHNLKARQSTAVQTKSS